jgi:hypothetical protein
MGEERNPNNTIRHISKRARRRRRMKRGSGWRRGRSYLRRRRDAMGGGEEPSRWRRSSELRRRGGCAKNPSANWRVTGPLSPDANWGPLLGSRCGVASLGSAARKSQARSYAFGSCFGFWRPEAAQKLNQTGAYYVAAVALNTATMFCALDIGNAKTVCSLLVS